MYRNCKIRFTYFEKAQYNHNVKFAGGRKKNRMKTYLEIGLIITSVALIVSVILQSKGAGLGGLTGADTGGVYSVRRGIERTLFYITIGLSVLFFILSILAIFIKS